MKQIFVMFALLLGVCAANAQTTDTVKYAAGNDLYRGITRKLPYRQMVTPYGVEVTFAKTVHIIFPAAVRYVDLGSNHIIAGKADGAENVIRVKATTEGFSGETNFSVICEDGSFFSFNAKYAHEPEMLNIEMKDFLENEDTSDFSHTRMNIHFRELGNESPLLVKLIIHVMHRFERIVIFFTLLENLLRFHEAVQRVLGSGGSLHYLLGGVDDALCQIAGV